MICGKGAGGSRRSSRSLRSPRSSRRKPPGAPPGPGGRCGRSPSRRGPPVRSPMGGRPWSRPPLGRGPSRRGGRRPPGRSSNFRSGRSSLRVAGVTVYGWRFLRPCGQEKLFQIKIGFRSCAHCHCGGPLHAALLKDRSLSMDCLSGDCKRWLHDILMAEMIACGCPCGDLMNLTRFHTSRPTLARYARNETAKPRRAANRPAAGKTGLCSRFGNSS